VASILIDPFARDDDVASLRTRARLAMVPLLPVPRLVDPCAGSPRAFAA